MKHVYDPKHYDPILFSGTAGYYARYRERTDSVFVEMLQREMHLDGAGRLLDVGCGTGNIVLRLALLFADAIGVDPDADMLSLAAREAEAAGQENIRWVHARAEDLPLDLGRFDLITMAASFHWMDRARVVEALYEMLVDGGALAHITNVAAPGVSSSQADTDPSQWPEVRAVIEAYLGKERRAGSGLYHDPGENAPWLEGSRFGPGKTLYARTGHPRVRTVDDIVGLILSGSGTAPHLFGSRLSDFEHELRATLLRINPSGEFAYTSSDVEILLFRR